MHLKSIQTCFFLHLHTDLHGCAEGKISSVAALEMQSPSEQIGTAITEPATQHTQEVRAQWTILYLSNNLSRCTHTPPAPVTIPYSEDTLPFCVPIALVNIMWAYYSDIWFNITAPIPFCITLFTQQFSFAPHHMDLNCEVCNWDSLTIQKMSLKFQVSVYISVKWYKVSIHMLLS